MRLTLRWRRNRVTHYSGDNPRLFDAFRNDVNLLDRVESVGVLFTDQKNGIKNELITQRASGDPFLCPARALGWIVRHLLLNGAPPDAPLYRHYYAASRRWRDIAYNLVTRGLRIGAYAVEEATGVPSHLLSVKGLRPGGATALLCAGVDSTATQVLGRWRSDAMLNYLRPQALTAHTNLASTMVNHGAYSYSPAAHLQQQLPAEAPPELQAAQRTYLAELERRTLASYV